MSSHTRKGRQARAHTISLPVICINDGDRLKKAKEAFSSLDLSSMDPSEAPGRVREVWQELRQAYEDTVNNNSNSDIHRPFPIWARSQFDPRCLEDLLTAGYLEDLLRVGYLEDRSPLPTGAPSASVHFKVDPWQFILHFDYIEREKKQAIQEISKKRPNLTFNQLYEEVQKNRLSRIKDQKNPKYEFLPCDFKACRSHSPWYLLSDWRILMMRAVKVSDNEDGSNAEHHYEAGQNQAGYEEGNDNGNPGNGYPAPVNNTRPISHEIDHTAGHDDEEDCLEELNDLVDNAYRRSIPSRVSSLPIITREKSDETGGDSEASTPIPPTPQAANVAIRRELSREQSSSLDALSGEGIFSSIEEQPFQDVRAVFLDYEKLMASLSTAKKSSEICIKQLKEDNAAHLERANRALLNPDAFFEDLQPVLERICYKVGNNNKKRKSWDDDNEKRKRIAAGLENEAYFKNASL